MPVDALPAMSAAIAHRGPDGEGFLRWADPGPLRAAAGGGRLEALEGLGPSQVAFAHRRLAVIDVDHRSDQPMVDEALGIAVTFNGEIYNYVELRRDLEQLGHRFRTACDTEVLLRSYVEWGPECVTRFVGMWAFGLLDTRRRRLLLSRDRFGIKPLYYAALPSGWGFASEIKALLAVPGFRPSPNREVLSRYLVAGVVDEGDETFLTGVLRVPPGSTLVVEGPWDTAPRIERYWTLTAAAEPADPVSAYRSAFEGALELHSRSDVRVGSCLSGGVDSSAIVCVVAELRRQGRVPDRGHEVFGYVPADGEFSEERYMRAVAERAGTPLVAVSPGPDRVRAALHEVIAGQDEPFASSSIVAQWFVFCAAREHGAKVMLDGQGADETLAGYESFFRIHGLGLLDRKRTMDYMRFALRFRRDRGEWPIPLGEALGRRFPSVEPRLRERAPHVAAPQLQVASLLTDDAYTDGYAGAFRNGMPSGLDELLRRQVLTRGLPALLRYEDHNSMAHSIEARVPFLDHRLVELAFALPDEWRLRGGVTKRVLREAVKASVPRQVLERRDKIGFRASPETTWTMAREGAADLDENVSDVERSCFRDGALTRALTSGDRSNLAERATWRVMNAKLWLRSR